MEDARLVSFGLGVAVAVAPVLVFVFLRLRQGKEERLGEVNVLQPGVYVHRRHGMKHVIHVRTVNGDRAYITDHVGGCTVSAKMLLEEYRYVGGLDD